MVETSAGDRTLLTIAPGHLIYDERVLRTVCSARRFTRSYYAVDRELFEQLGAQRDAILRDIQSRVCAHTSILLLPPWKRIRFLSRVTRQVYAVKVARQARELKPDVVHIHESGFLGLLIAFWVRRYLPACTIIFDYHDWIPSEIAYTVRGIRGLYGPAKALFMPYLRRLARAVDVAICISDGQARWTEQELGIRRTLVIQNVRPPGPAAQLSQVFRPQLLFAGNVMRIRRLEFVIDVIAQLRARGVNASFAVCGDLTEPEYVQAVQAYAQRQGVIDLLRFHGRYRGDQELANTAGPGTVGIALGLTERIDTDVNRIASANKFFSYLALGIPVLVDAQYENMRQIAESAGAGAAFTTVTSCADAAVRIWQSPDVWYEMRQNALRLAHELNSDSYAPLLEALYA